MRFLVSGHVAPAVVAALYRRAAAVLFPSQYEGFGLPLLHAAANGTPVIACETATTREVTEAFGIGSLVHVFRSFGEIPALIDRAVAAERTLPSVRRTWADAAEETAAFMDAVLAQPVDLPLLEERATLCRTLERIRHEHGRRSLLRRLRSFVSRAIRRGRRVLLRMGVGT